MKREDKNTIIDSLTESIGHSKHFYLADISDLDAGYYGIAIRSSSSFSGFTRLIIVK